MTTPEDNMKRQFYFDAVERDLLRTALERFKDGIERERKSDLATSHWCAGEFVERRVDEMLERLKEIPA